MLWIGAKKESAFGFFLILPSLPTFATEIRLRLVGERYTLFPVLLILADGRFA